MRRNLLALSALAGLALTSSALATGTYTTGFGLAVPIPDGSGSATPGATASANLVVPSDGVNGDVIVSINVGIAIAHTWQGDLTVRLTHVSSGNSITLLNRPGVPQSTFGSGEDNYGVPGSAYMNFTDSAASIYDAAPVPNVVGDWKPEGPGTLGLNFGGLSAAGTWTLSVFDSGGGDVGSIDGFCIETVTQQVPAPGALGLLGLGGLAAARRRRRTVALAGAAAGLALGSSAMAQFNSGPNEVEDNNTKAQADTNGGVWTLPAALGSTPGVIVGTSTGTSTTVAGVGSADYFHLRTAAQGTLAIYRNRLAITTQGSAGHTGTLRGFSGNSGTTDAPVQTSSTGTTPARMNQWYSFGRASDMYYRVTGTTATTAPYSVDYNLSVVTPKPAGGYTEGNFSFSTVGIVGEASDTEMFLYDSNFNQIGQNDDNLVPGTGFQSLLNIALTAGTYYLCVSDFSSMSNLAVGPVANGAFSDRSTSGPRLDFVDNLVRAGTGALAAGAVSININDGNGNVLTASDAQGAFDAQWYVITVNPVPAPGSVALLGLGGLMAARRRRA